MRIIKTKLFSGWVDDEGVTDEMLCDAISEMEEGLFEANLGGNVYKKRIARQGRGKSSGFRTLIATKLDDIAFFMYGFSKNQRANISKKELKALKMLAEQLLGYSTQGLAKAIDAKEFIEVECDEEVNS